MSFGCDFETVDAGTQEAAEKQVSWWCSVNLTGEAGLSLMSLIITGSTAAGKT